MSTPTYAGTHRWEPTGGPVAEGMNALTMLATRAMIADRRERLEVSRPWFGPEGRHDIATMTPLPGATFIRNRLLVRKFEREVQHAKAAKDEAYAALVASTRSFGVLSRSGRP